MPVNVETIAKEFSLSEEDLIKESLRAFLLAQLRILDADRRARCAKFGVSDFEGMERLIEQGAVSEEAILEDYKEVDYLTGRIEQAKAMLHDL